MTTSSCADASDSPLTAAARAKTTPLVDRAVRRAGLGDRDALRFLCIRYADEIYDYARQIVPGQGEAHELTRRTFTNLETSIDRYDDDDGLDVSFPLWVRRIVRSIAEQQADSA